MHHRHSHGWGHGHRFMRRGRGMDEAFEGRRGHGGGGRHALGRFFAHGDLRLVILHLIAEKPRHGYDIIKAIEESVGGAYSPSPGVIYPTLTLLGDMGLIEAADSDGAKKLFAITAAGQAELDANKDAVEALIARLAEVGDERQRTDSASVRRAMGNLRAVLMNRLGDRDLDEPTLHAVVALIDEAAQKIERLG